MDPPPLDLQCLPRIALLQVFGHLRVAPDVLALASASTLLRDVAAESAAWKSLCEARWGAERLNAHVCPHPADRSQCDYKALYLSANGWRRPLRSCAPPPGPPHGSGAVAVATGPDGAAHLLSVQEAITGDIMASDPTPRTFQLHRRAFFSVQPPAWVGPPAAATWIDPSAALFAMGDACGGLHLIHKDVNGGGILNPADLDLISYHADGPGADYPVTCLRSHAGSNSLAALWDRGEAEGWHPHGRGCVKILDVAAPGGAAALGVKGAMAEVFDHYELCTINAVDSTDSEAQNSGGFEWVGGSVKLCQDRADGGGVCPRCHPALPASLCHHQHRSSQAVLLFFDIRTGERPGAVVSRHPLPHRSMFPRIETARGGDLLLLSSAGAPLTVWDRRNLGAGPVATPALAVPGNPLGRRTEALCLSVHGGMVAGRADDGWIGVWDLETVMTSGKKGLAPAAVVALPPPETARPEDAKPPRTEVWLGPDWLVANAMGTLCCCRLQPGAGGSGADDGP